LAKMHEYCHLLIFQIYLNSWKLINLKQNKMVNQGSDMVSLHTVHIMFKSSVCSRIWKGWWGWSVEWKLSAKNVCAFTHNYLSTFCKPLFEAIVLHA
jgi:hypothetical protein